MEPVSARQEEEVFIRCESRVLASKQIEKVDINAALAVVPFRIAVTGVVVRGMPGVAAVIYLVRVVATAPVAVTASIAVSLPEIAVTAVTVRRVVMGTAPVPIVRLGIAHRAKREEYRRNGEE